MTTLRDRIMYTIHGSDIWSSVNLDGASLGDVQGWSGDHPSLARLARSNSSCVADVGVWKGQSTITLARAMKEAAIDGCVIAIDTFLGSIEHWGGGRTGLFKNIGGRPNLYETFIYNAKQAGVEDMIVPLVQTSKNAAAILKALDIRPDLIHVDAAHEYEDVKRDVADYWAILAPGGHLIGDDYSLFWPGVIRAAGEHSAAHGLPLQIDGQKWIMRKPL